MTQLQDRIAQFRKMTTDDPENDLGHFRLGQLLAEAGNHEEAIASLRRTLELNPQLSKAYQVLADSLLKLDRRDEAAKTLTEGYRLADERGERIPRDEMGKRLTELSQPVPASKQRAPSVGGETGFHCRRPGCVAGGHGRQLPAPPMNDEMGRRIQETVCADCWQDWLRNMSIKVINEMRLDLSTEHGQEVYDQVMREYLGLE